MHLHGCFHFLFPKKRFYIRMLVKDYKSFFGAIWVWWNLPSPSMTPLPASLVNSQNTRHVFWPSTLHPNCTWFPRWRFFKFLRKNHDEIPFFPGKVKLFYAVIGRWTTPCPTRCYLATICWWDGHGFFHETEYETIFPRWRSSFAS